MRHRAIRWILYCLGWTLAGLFFASQTYLAYRYSSGTAHWGVILKISLAQWYAWALLAPAVWWISNRLPLARRGWWRSLLILLPASLFGAFAHWAIYAALYRYVIGIENFPSSVFLFHTDVLTFWVIVGASEAYQFYRRYHESEARTSQLSVQLAQAQLQALRMQLHPHFLFNTLNAIATLVHSDPEAADRMLARLSELLRMTIADVDVQEVALAKELEFLERYLEIEQTRFADRLTVRMDIAAETLTAKTPYLILQPLVENAVRHGIAPRSSPGKIEIRARRDNGSLILEVRDNGPGMTSQAQDSTRKGMGLASTRERLARLYGDAARLQLEHAAGGGLVVTLQFPFQAA
ncbi:MAG: sensor histidine kinase [Candidatus Acidiferrales bacterium]